MIITLFRLFSGKLSTTMRMNRVKAMLFFLCLLWYSASGFLYFELEFKPDLGWGDAIWWALVTMATVGYGDLFPTTFFGRYLVGVPSIIFGIGFLGYIITSVATKLVETRSRRLQGMSSVSLSNHIIIFNYSHVDEVLALVSQFQSDRTMRDKGVCLVDEQLEEIPPRLAEVGVQFVKGSPTDEDTLRNAGLDRATHAIVLSRDRLDRHADDQNLVTVMVIEKINPRVFTIVEVIDTKKKHQFALAGANDIICIGELSVNLIAREIMDPGVNSVFLELSTNARGSEMYIVGIDAGAGSTFRDLQLRGIEKSVSVIGLLKEEVPMLNCEPGTVLRLGDRAIVISADRVGDLVV